MNKILLLLVFLFFYFFSFCQKTESDRTKSRKVYLENVLLNDAERVYTDGFIDYSDSITHVTPIVYTSGVIAITNDGRGDYSTNVYAPTFVDTLFNCTTNRFDFSDLDLGNEVILRIDIIIETTQPNQEIVLKLTFDISGTPYDLIIETMQFKNAGAHQLVKAMPFYIGNVGTKNNPAELLFSSTNGEDANIVVNGFYISIKRKF